MASPLKDLYSPSFYNTLSTALQKTVSSFNQDKFLSEIFIPAFASMELKERMKHTTLVMHQFLPADFGESVGLIKNIIDQLRAIGIGNDGLAYMFIPDYVETYGIDYYQESVDALEFITQFVSCEFAVRPFILKY